MKSEELMDHYAGLAMMAYIITSKDKDIDHNAVRFAWKYAEMMMNERKNKYGRD